MYEVFSAGAAPAGDAGLSPAEIKTAGKLERRKCYRCHKPHDPRNYSTKEWDRWMDKMSRKARLKSADEELLRRYFKSKRRP